MTSSGIHRAPSTTSISASSTRRQAASKRRSIPTPIRLLAPGRCGAPTNNEICSFCALTQRARPRRSRFGWAPPDEAHIPRRPGRESKWTADRRRARPAHRSKKRRYLIDLAEGGEFHSHSGVLPHDELIGKPEGRPTAPVGGWCSSPSDRPSPTMSSNATRCSGRVPQGHRTDHHSGRHLSGWRVLESGSGSGALSTGMLRAGADIVGYELATTSSNTPATPSGGSSGQRLSSVIEPRFGTCIRGSRKPNWTGSCLIFPSRGRSFLTPNRPCVEAGSCLAYTPSIIQVSQLHEALEESRFGMAETVEALHRGWYVNGTAVRPDHRMVGHTGFLTPPAYWPSEGRCVVCCWP